MVAIPEYFEAIFCNKSNNHFLLFLNFSHPLLDITFYLLLGNDQWGFGGARVDAVE